MKVSALFLLLVACGSAWAAPPENDKQPVDLVAPNIGGIGQLLSATIPYVQVPHGMARLAPITTPGITDRYLADKIYGFPVGPAMLSASTGGLSSSVEDYASEYDHDFETATPYHYAVDLESWDVHVDSTATQAAGIYRFVFPATPHAHLVLSMEKGARLEVVSDHAVQGSEPLDGTVAHVYKPTGETREYFFAEFSQPLKGYKTWRGEELSSATTQSGDHIGFVSDSPTAAGQVLEVRMGISYISTEQAKRNLDEQVAARAFNTVEAETREVWEQALGSLNVAGGTEKQRSIFYTALYRSLGRMTDITEDGRYFSGYDHAVHDSQGHDFYVDDGLWDTFRSLHPLQLLVEPVRQQDMVRSYVRMYEQSGSMPSFPSFSGEQAVMIGHHAAEFILDLYAKGYRDFDAEKAYEGLRKNETEATLLPWQRGPLTVLDHTYFDKGFFPALALGETEDVPQVTEEKRQAVSVTLETAYDDWAVAQLAKALGHTADATYFTKLAENYKNVFNPAIGFMAPKSADGNWVAEFDPKLGGGQGGRDYFTEVDSWLYTFNVQFDSAGLIQLLGGRGPFNAKLDQLFVEQYGTSKYKFLSQFPDATGLVGLYAQGNEPSFHIPYLYDFSGQPWKTQKRVRELLSLWYGDGPLGIPGDDDGGETSSWYVLRSLGFYPVCPGSPVYEIGSPIFSRSVIRLGEHETFTILADHVSAQNKYIQSAMLNGKPWSKPWFRQTDMGNGGVLALEMGDKPNRQWGSALEDAPPSMSNREP
jgi:predicted alpha-1,2-mannosidase